MDKYKAFLNYYKKELPIISQYKLEEIKQDFEIAWESGEFREPYPRQNSFDKNKYLDELYPHIK